MDPSFASQYLNIPNPNLLRKYHLSKYKTIKLIFIFHVFNKNVNKKKKK